MNIVATITAALLYTAVATGANMAAAGEIGGDHLKSLRSGDMKKLIVTADEPVSVDLGDMVVIDAAGNEVPFRSLVAGRPALINFWATWCAPCRKEMPSIDALAAAFPDESFAVIPVAAGKNPIDDIEAFFEETGVSNLPIIRDPRMKLAGSFGVFGLPTTILLDRNGNVVARLSGDADWNSESARAIVRAIIDMKPAS